MNYEFNTNISLEQLSLHDSRLIDLKVLGDDLYIFVDMINIRETADANPYDVAKQTDEGLLVLKNYSFRKYEKSFFQRENEEKIENVVIEKPEIEELKLLIKFNESFIYNFEYADDSETLTCLEVDSLEGYMLWIFFDSPTIEAHWNVFVDDAWWTKRRFGTPFKEISKRDKIPFLIFLFVLLAILVIVPIVVFNIFNIF